MKKKSLASKQTSGPNRREAGTTNASARREKNPPKRGRITSGQGRGTQKHVAEPSPTPSSQSEEEVAPQTEEEQPFKFKLKRTRKREKTPEPKNIPGAPKDLELLRTYQFHISSVIWNGGARDPYTMEVQYHKKSFDKWSYEDLPAFVKTVVGNARMHHLATLAYDVMDRSLLNAFNERFYPETNSFHLPVGELFISLYDVVAILGLRVDGRPVVLDGNYNFDGLVELVTVHLGVPQVDAFKELNKNSSYITFKWLRDRFQVYGEDATDEQKIFVARAYMLYLIGTLLFPNKSGDAIPARFLEFFINLDEVGDYSWGSATLGNLFRELGKGSRIGCKTLSGCMNLLQTWIYEHFPYMERAKTRSEYVDGQPRLGKWKPSFPLYDFEMSLDHIRIYLDRLLPAQVVFDPYSAVRALFPIPNLAFYEGLLPCLEVEEPHYPDRGLRQFSLIQTKPRWPKYHEFHIKGNNASNYNADYNEYPPSYAKWTNHLLSRDRRSTPVQYQSDCSSDYMEWYADASHPIVINPERAPPVPDLPATGNLARRLKAIARHLLCLGDASAREAGSALDNYCSPTFDRDFSKFSTGGGELGESSTAQVPPVAEMGQDQRMEAEAVVGEPGTEEADTSEIGDTYTLNRYCRNPRPKKKN